MITQRFHDESVQRFYGLSTDTKPTDCDNGSTFVEVNTCKAYIFNAATKTWTEIPSGGSPGNLGALAYKDSASTTFTPTLTTSVSNGALTVSFSQDTITVT